MTSEQSPSLTEAAAEIRQAVTRLARQMRAARSAEALSINKLSVLSRLHRHGPATPGELAAAEYQQPQSLTRVFAELERAALITRSPGEHDRRQSVISLNQAGRDALTRDMAERDSWLASALAELTHVEREMLRLAAGLMDRLCETPLPAPESTSANN